MKNVGKVVPLTLGFIIVYYLLGTVVFAPLLIPVGCSGSLGDARPVKPPTTEFNVSYEPTTETLYVEHIGGDTLFDNSTEQLVIEIESHQEIRRFDWTELGGAYPVRAGDELSVREISGSDGDESTKVVRVVWSGPAQGPDYPLYCPGSSEPPTITETLARSEIR